MWFWPKKLKSQQKQNKQKIEHKNKKMATDIITWIHDFELKDADIILEKSKYMLFKLFIV